MLAVDTNVLVRLLARDDARQTARSDELFQAEELLILNTVLLETEWVLRYSYAFDRSFIGAALRGVAGLPNVRLEDGTVVAKALDWFAAGMDFADALHLASSAGCDGLASFDRKLAAAAKRLPGTKVVLLS